MVAHGACSATNGTSKQSVCTTSFDDLPITVLHLDEHPLEEWVDEDHAASAHDHRLY